MPGWMLLLVAGAFGAFLAVRWRLPGGSFLGAMLATAALSLALAEPQAFPSLLRSSGLILAGISVGAVMEQKALLRMRRVLPAAIVVVLLFIAASVGIGHIVYALSGDAASPATIVLGVMPGGLSGMAAAAMDLQVNLPITASMQSLRLFLVLGSLPMLLRGIVRVERTERSR